MSSPASNGLKTRVRLDLQQKIEILNFIANGKKQIEASKHFNVPRGTVCVLVKDQDKLRKMETSNRRSFENLHFSHWKSLWSAGLNLRAKTKCLSPAISFRKKQRTLLKNSAFETFQLQKDGCIVSKPETICAGK